MSGDRDDLEDWLRENPGANDDLADLPHLRELFQSACPPEPNEAGWKAVCSRIHRSLGPGRSRRPWRIVAAGAAAAAILALLLARPLWRTNKPVPEVVRRIDEPFAVVDPDDVAIVSMDARDVAALVVGEPPVGDDLEFARPEDVHVIRCERCPFSGRKARPESGDEVLMFVAATVQPGNE